MTTTTLFPPSSDYHNKNKIVVVTAIYDDRLGLETCERELAKVIDDTVTAWEASPDTCVLIHVVAVSNSLSSPFDCSQVITEFVEDIDHHHHDDVMCRIVVFDAMTSKTTTPNALQTRCSFLSWNGCRCVGYVKGY